MRGDYRKQEFFEKHVLPFVSRESGKKDKRGREKKCVATAGRIGDGLCWFIYTPVFTVSWLVVRESVRASG